MRSHSDGAAAVQDENRRRLLRYEHRVVAVDWLEYAQLPRNSAWRRLSGRLHGFLPALHYTVYRSGAIRDFHTVDRHFGRRLGSRRRVACAAALLQRCHLRVATFRSITSFHRQTQTAATATCDYVTHTWTHGVDRLLGKLAHIGRAGCGLVCLRTADPQNDKEILTG